MSAPLVLSSRDLRRLADALDELDSIRVKHFVTPGQSYEPGVTLRTEAGDTVDLKVSLRDGELVIDDRYGS